MVSNYISSNISALLISKLAQNQSPDIALHHVYKELFEALIKGPIEITFSGATAVTCFIQDDIIYTANSGDSRAILGYQHTDGSFDFKLLSHDHKLSVPGESERVLKAGGRVDSFTLATGEKCGPLRVWLPKENIPGLAMSRCIGDLVASSVGVTWKPGSS